MDQPARSQGLPARRPGNQLGSRWMGFQGSNLGIHEAIDPASIGTYSSNGCVGLVREDVQELYDLVPIGTPITIIDSRKPS
jgi:lipoprotein-anchoring transpeptidase ErfK/SrfK